MDRNLLVTKISFTERNSSIRSCDALISLNIGLKLESSLEVGETKRRELRSCGVDDQSLLGVRTPAGVILTKFGARIYAGLDIK